jgi:hypothetical protein
MGKYIIIAVKPINDSIPETETVRKVRLRKTWGSMMGSSACPSAPKKSTQNSKALLRRLIICGDAQG